MDKELTQIPENAASKAEDRKREKYPVQQIAAATPVTAKVIKSAVKEINPDIDSFDYRG